MVNAELYVNHTRASQRNADANVIVRLILKQIMSQPNSFIQCINKT